MTVAVFSLATAPIAPNAFAAGSNGDAWDEATAWFAQLFAGNMSQHSSDPLPDNPGNETPRAGVGNLKGTGPDGDWCGLLNALGAGNFCS